jgi:hypothetical protein
MEEFWEKDPELFIRLNTMLKINLAETDLKQLKRSITQILRKEFKTIKMIAEYFKFPKLF